MTNGHKAITESSAAARQVHAWQLGIVSVPVLRGLTGRRHKRVALLLPNTQAYSVFFDNMKCAPQYMARTGLVIWIWHEEYCCGPLVKSQFAAGSAASVIACVIAAVYRRVPAESVP